MRRTHTVAAATLFLALLTGCVPTHSPTPTPEPTTTPVFASDDEALTAAETAYRAYLSVSDSITADGGANPERLAPYVSAEELSESLASYERFARNGLHTAGATTFDTFKFTSYDGTEIEIYTCLDVSGIRIIDSTGADKTPARDNRLPLQVSFSWSQANSRLIVSRSDAWTGQDFC